MDLQCVDNADGVFAMGQGCAMNDSRRGQEWFTYPHRHFPRFTAMFAVQNLNGTEQGRIQETVEVSFYHDAVEHERVEFVMNFGFFFSPVDASVPFYPIVPTITMQYIKCCASEASRPRQQNEKSLAPNLYPVPMLMGYHHLV